MPVPFLCSEWAPALLLPCMGSTPTVASPCLLPGAVLGGGREGGVSPPATALSAPRSLDAPGLWGTHVNLKLGEGLAGVTSYGTGALPGPDCEPAWSLGLRFVRLSPPEGRVSLRWTLAPSPVYVHRLRLGRIFTWVWDGAQSLSHVQLFAAPWTVAHQAPLPMGFSRQKYWSGLPFPPPGELPDPGIELRSLVSPRLLQWQGDSLSLAPPRKCVGWRCHTPQVAGAQRLFFLP